VLQSAHEQWHSPWGVWIVERLQGCVEVVSTNRWHHIFANILFLTVVMG
jgi:hypothetical protein